MMAEDRDQGSGIGASAEGSTKAEDRKYRKKPVMVRAFQWFGDPPSGLPDWALPHCTQDAEVCRVETFHGQTMAENGDWIIRGPAGDFCVCKADIFEATYEPFGWISGISLIAEERRRQVDEEGWSAEHDDLHSPGDLALAAICYAAPVPLYRLLAYATGPSFVDPWPEGWREGYDKRFVYGSRRDNPGNMVPHPSSYTDTERLDLLVKSGALIAAEIDRLLRLQAPEGGGDG